jgi:hypothetical protein
LVNGYRRLPRPPPKMIAKTWSRADIIILLSRDLKKQTTGLRAAHRIHYNMKTSNVKMYLIG